MQDDKRRTVRTRRHQPWDDNPSEQWSNALDHMDQGEWDAAIGHCERAIAIWPTYYDAWLLLAGAFEEKGEYDRALDSIRRAAELASLELSQAWNNLASLHLVRGEWEEAITIDRVLDLIDPTRHAIIRYRMAVCYTQLGDEETGFKWLREAIEMREDLYDRALGEPLLVPLQERLQRLVEAGD
ncbi:MAG: tetratricopeptide repeat protein [Anaerolineae bacterium]|nr:tetratricopeptide repeat protein [Anaerolineae bacterium]